MIKIAKTKDELIDCFKVLSPLRPHLSLDRFLVNVSRMSESTGYQLAFLSDSEIKAVVGFRISEWLHTGMYLEIEELITKEEERSMGYGSRLFDWTIAFAKENKCNQLRLVSGTSRGRAHEFYLTKGMSFEAKYFSINV